MKEKIGIISDTHGLLRPEVLEILKDCKYILHAGDVNKDEILDVLRSMGNLYVVRGNNDKDWAENLRTSLSFTIGGVKSCERTLIFAQSTLWIAPQNLQFTLWNSRGMG